MHAYSELSFTVIRESQISVYSKGGEPVAHVVRLQLPSSIAIGHVGWSRNDLKSNDNWRAMDFPPLMHKMTVLVPAPVPVPLPLYIYTCQLFFQYIVKLLSLALQIIAPVS